MVRNSPSVQSLRESMVDHPRPTCPQEQQPGQTQIPRPSAPPLPVSQAEDNTPLKRLDRRSLQLCGNDAYTKALMNRLATGQATDTEMDAFNRQIHETVAGNPPANRMDHTVTGKSSNFRPHMDLSGQWHPPAPLAYAPWRLADQFPPFSYSHPRTGSLNMGGPAAVPSDNTRPRPNKETPDRLQQATRQNAQKYTKPFCDFLTLNPTVFHAVAAMKRQLRDAGFKELSERDTWSVVPSGSYFVERNGSSLIAFTVGGRYKPGNGAAILAGHVDAVTAKLKPISQVPNKAGYLQLGVAPYAGGLNSTWWDRDLGVGGRVLVKEGDKVYTRLVSLDWPIARIPTLAPHFGAAAAGPFNPETQMVPIIGLEGTDASTGLFADADHFRNPPLLGGEKGPANSFLQTQSPALVDAICKALDIGPNSAGTIINWELELFDLQPATVGGLNKEFIFAGRIDDKLCSWAALQALVESEPSETEDSSVIKMVALFDDEEIGSLLRQGARGNFLPQTVERTVESLSGKPGVGLMGQTYANSFLVSSDVTHAINPNFVGAYLENHAPHLNVGVTVAADPNGHMTTDAVSTAILKRCADNVGAQLQVFQIRNDSRSGGTVGPMLSSATGIRAIDAGLPQLSMHSIRATTGALDPGLGVIMFSGFLNTFEDVDREFRD